MDRYVKRIQISSPRDAGHGMALPCAISCDWRCSRMNYNYSMLKLHWMQPNRWCLAVLIGKCFVSWSQLVWGCEEKSPTNKQQLKAAVGKAWPSIPREESQNGLMCMDAQDLHPNLKWSLQLLIKSNRLKHIGNEGESAGRVETGVRGDFWQKSSKSERGGTRFGDDGTVKKHRQQRWRCSDFHVECQIGHS